MLPGWSKLCLLFQDFKVLTLLGKGSFACVYRAKSINTSMEVAIKTVRRPRWSWLITALAFPRLAAVWMPCPGVPPVSLCQEPYTHLGLLSD